MNFKSYDFEKIIDSVPLDDLVSEYGVDLIADGGDFIAFCPFHDDIRTKSFRIYNATCSWYCFGCGIGGSIFDFVMNMENVSFSRAVEMLAEKAGISEDYVGDLNFKSVNSLLLFKQLRDSIEKKSLILVRKKWFSLKSECNSEELIVLYIKMDQLWDWHDVIQGKFDKYLFKFKLMSSEEIERNETQLFVTLNQKLHDFYSKFVSKLEEIK